ncbi:MAG TPA: ABC transporter ATP-binding protein [Albitalea sp.]|uniref:ABC transporter ATP-binding protein n=1 Tax=Piscinibacter sp. TaxID=1903157 RepID=UPI002ED15582
MRNIHKRFGQVHANRGVDLAVRRGSIHGIVGENGAGKSTLMSVLYGFHEADEGSILIDGKPLRLTCPQDAIAHGIGMVHQHFMLVDRFTVLENIVLGAEGGLTLARGMNRARTEVTRLSLEFGLGVDSDARIRDLPVSVLQRVEILKALYKGARVLILDEPTAVLSPDETQQLFRMLLELRARGATILIVTHKLKEVMDLTDRVTVMRAGSVVATRDTPATTAGELAELMIGRRLGAVVPLRVPQAHPLAPRLRADDLHWRDAHGVTRLNGVSFTLHAGEILGVAGVSGNGQSELLELLAGLSRPQQGSFRIECADGKSRVVTAAHPCRPREMRRLGIAHVPEHRHRFALVLDFSAWESAALGYQDDADLRRGPFLAAAAMRERCKGLMRKFDVRPVDENLISSKFSGGNQQKLVLAREFARAPRVLLIGQPTRGVDIGAIEFIHARLRELRDDGCAVLLVSAELDEVLALSDRVMVMSAGRVTGVIPRLEATERRLGEMMGAGVVREVA